MYPILRSLLILVTVGFSTTPIHSESGSRQVEPAAARECRESKEVAFEKLSGIRPPWEAKAAREAGLETLERAIELCWRVAKEIEDPALAAEMAAVAYLSRARRSMALREPRDRKREILTEGIEVVRGFHHDRDPALILLLKQSAFAEWPHDHELAAERMEQAVEIAREAFGKDDARVAVRLTDLAFLYAPTSIAPSRSGTDAKKAGRAYEEAARSFAALEDPRAYSEEVIRLAAYMQDFFEETGRAAEAADVTELFSELLAEEERLREAARSEESQPGKPLPEGTKPEAPQSEEVPAEDTASEDFTSEDVLPEESQPDGKAAAGSASAPSGGLDSNRSFPLSVGRKSRQDAGAP